MGQFELTINQHVFYMFLDRFFPSDEVAHWNTPSTCCCSGVLGPIVAPEGKKVCPPLVYTLNCARVTTCRPGFALRWLSDLLQLKQVETSCAGPRLAESSYPPPYMADRWFHLARTLLLGLIESHHVARAGGRLCKMIWIFLKIWQSPIAICRCFQWVVSLNSGQVLSYKTPLWGWWSSRIFCHNSAFPCCLLSRIFIMFFLVKNIFSPPPAHRNVSFSLEVNWQRVFKTLLRYTSIWIRVNNHIMTV